MTRKSYSIVQHPDPRKLNATRKRLPKFKPHDLQPILNAARAVEGQSWSDHAVLEIRRRNQKQMADLLRRLGVDPSQPDAWQRGFFLLAFYHHGVGNLTWRIPRTNRNAATWTNAADLNLLREVTTLMAAAGISELQAIKRIVSDPQKRKLFPYREQNRIGSLSSLQNEKVKRQTALRRRLQHLKASSSWDSVMDLLLGSSWRTQAAIEPIQ